MLKKKKKEEKEEETPVSRLHTTYIPVSPIFLSFQRFCCAFGNTIVEGGGDHRVRSGVDLPDERLASEGKRQTRYNYRGNRAENESINEATTKRIFFRYRIARGISGYRESEDNL